jgi:hypothetical protein
MRRVGELGLKNSTSLISESTSRYVGTTANDKCGCPGQP